MPTVDREAMPAAQRAAWDRLWRVLLAPESNEKPHAGDSLAASTDAGETATVSTATGRNDRTVRSGNDD